MGRSFCLGAGGLEAFEIAGGLADGALDAGDLAVEAAEEFFGALEGFAEIGGA
jgi:hypothetical protein